MIHMIADASLPDLAPWFHPTVHITRFDTTHDIHKQLQGQEIVLCRSTLQVNAALLADTQIRCIATLSSGTDHIDASMVSQRKIHVIDAKGANAPAVADYILASVAFVQQRGLLTSQRVGIIGMGVVGTAVATRLQALGFQIYGYDPLRAQHDPTFLSCDLDAIWSCELLCIHANLHETPPYPTRHLLDAHFLSHLKPSTVIINAARGEIVDEEALMASEKLLYYCTDVYRGEPDICEELVQRATLCTPHIAGHSIEAKHRTLALVSQKLHQWLNLPMPKQPPTVTASLPLTDQKTNWQTQVLAHYNPEVETQTLKHAKSLPKTFLALRAAHCGRHEFIWSK